MGALAYTLIPVAAVLLGSIMAIVRRPGEALVSAMQHLAAGVVFAAAATEILPPVLHRASPMATLVGGDLGVMVMLGLEADRRALRRQAGARRDGGPRYSRRWPGPRAGVPRRRPRPVCC